MATKLQNLTGENEPAADTIRRNLQQFVNLDGVAFISEGGINQGRDVESEIELTSIDMGLMEKEEQAFVKVFDGNRHEIAGSNDFAYMEQLVYIQIFGARLFQSNIPLILKVRDQIDSWVLQNQYGPYTKSFEANNSAIISLAVRSIDWIRTAENTDQGITDHLSGELPVRMQLNIR